MRHIRSFGRRSILLLATFSLLGLVASPPAFAAKTGAVPKTTISFIAVVESSDFSGVNPGDRIIGSDTYNSKLPDSNLSDPTVGDYQHNAAPYGIKVDLGAFVAKTDPNDVDFLVEIVNRPDRDNYLLRSYNNISTGPQVNHIAWQLDDSTGTALKNDKLPTKPPKLSDWQSVFGLTIEGRDFFIRAHVTRVHSPTRPKGLRMAGGGVVVVDGRDPASSGSWCTRAFGQKGDHGARLGGRCDKRQ